MPREAFSLMVLLPPHPNSPAQLAPSFPLKQLTAGLACFGGKLARRRWPEGQVLAHMQATELRALRTPLGWMVCCQGSLRGGLRPGLLGVLKVSLKKLRVNKQTKQNQTKVPSVRCHGQGNAHLLIAIRITLDSVG